MLPGFIGLETEELVSMATGTIRNFLNYILYHDVCPEYHDNIMAAREVCDIAKVELWKSQQACTWAPGDFNVACSTLFGGYYYGCYTGDKEWSDDMGLGMPEDTARKVAKFGIVGSGTLEQASLFRLLADSNQLKSTCLDLNGLEVTSVSAPDPDVRDFYHSYASDLQPLGKIRARPWQNPKYVDYDDEDGLVNNTQYDSAKATEYEFFLEESILKHCFVGMKLEASVWEINCGIYYIDNVLAALCSFYTVLPNESMIGWKKPRDLRADDIVCEYPEGEERDEKDSDMGD